jgi:hypothetical protein
MVAAMWSARDAGPLELLNGPPGVRRTTPPALAAVPLNNVSRSARYAGARASAR